MIAIFAALLIACPQPSDPACIALPFSEFVECADDRAALNECNDDRRTDTADAARTLRRCGRDSQATQTRADALERMLDAATANATPPARVSWWIPFAVGAALGAATVYALP